MNCTCPELLGFKDWIPAFAGMTTYLRHKTLKNVIPAQAGIHKKLHLIINPIV
jgi:hypothetical protein